MCRANSLILTAFGLLSLVMGDQLHCYMPDGSNADVGTAPCNLTAAVSACCDPRDSCTSSGLCLGASGWIYRSACTDQTWTSPACAQQCHADPLTQTPYGTFAPIVPCASGVVQDLYCCASSKGNCCPKNFTLGNTGFAFKNGTDAILAQSTQTTSTSAAATVTVTAPAATSTTSTTSSSSNLGLAVGAGVGIPLGILALGILGFLIWRERKKSTRAKAQLAAQQGNNPGWPPGQTPQMMWAGTPAPTNATPYQHAGSPPIHPGTEMGGEAPNSQYNAWKAPEPQPPTNPASQGGLHEMRG